MDKRTTNIATNKQAQTLIKLVDFYHRRKYWPSNRELASALGFSSHSYITRQIAALRAKKYIRPAFTGAYRSYILLEKGQKLYDDYKAGRIGEGNVSDMR